MNTTVIKYRKWSIIAMGMSALSLFIGGTLLSIVALVFAIHATRQLKPQVEANPQDPFTLGTARIAKNAIVMSLVALVLNVVTMITLMPALMEQMGLAGGAGAATSAGGIF